MARAGATAAIIVGEGSHMSHRFCCSPTIMTILLPFCQAPFAHCRPCLPSPHRSATPHSPYPPYDRAGHNGWTSACQPKRC